MNYMRRNRQRSSIITSLFFVIWLVSVLAGLVFSGVIIYIAIHFIAKFW